MNWHPEQTERDMLDILRSEEDKWMRLGTAYHEEDRDLDYPEDEEE